MGFGKCFHALQSVVVKFQGEFEGLCDRFVSYVIMAGRNQCKTGAETGLGILTSALFHHYNS